MKHSFAATCLAKGRLLPRLSLRSCDAESGACCGLPEAPVLCGTLRGVPVWARSGPHGRGALRAAWRIDGRDAPDGRVAPKGCRYARHTVCGAGGVARTGRDARRGRSAGGSVACGVALGGSVARGAALRGQHRLRGSLWGQRRSGGVALRRMASLEAPLCGDGVARGVVVRRGVAVGGAEMGLSRRVRASRRVSRDPASGGHRVWNRCLGVRMIRRPCLPGGGYRAVRRSVRGYCARPGSRAYRVGFGTPRRGITCGFDIRGRRVRVQRRQRLRQVAAARPEALHRLERCVLGGVSAGSPSLVGCASGTGLR